MCYNVIDRSRYNGKPFKRQLMPLSVPSIILISVRPRGLSAVRAGRFWTFRVSGLFICDRPYSCGPLHFHRKLLFLAFQLHFVWYASEWLVLVAVAWVECHSAFCETVSRKLPIKVMKPIALPRAVWWRLSDSRRSFEFHVVACALLCRNQSCTFQSDLCLIIACFFRARRP